MTAKAVLIATAIVVANSNAVAQPAPFKARFPRGVALPAATKNGDFWPLLLERICTDPKGALRSDRTDICIVSGGTLTTDPGTANSMIETWLDSAVIDSARMRQDQQRVVDLKKVIQGNLMSLIQPANDSTPGVQGSPAETSASPSVKPVSQAGVETAVSGTQGGMRFLASIAVNPAGLVTTSASTVDQSTQKAGTLASRVADLSLVVPINPSSNNVAGGLGAFDFVGVRLRANAMPFIKNSLYDNAKKEVEAAFAAALKAESDSSKEVRQLISSFDPSHCAETVLDPKPATDCGKVAPSSFDRIMRDTEACVEAIATTVPSNIENACHASLASFDASVSAETKLKNSLRQMRDAYDADYVGVDARYDFGDPTFSGKAQARGHHFLVGLAAGHRWVTDIGERDWFFGLKVRVGYQMTSLNNDMDKTSSFDFAAGVETGVIAGVKTFRLNAGVEGRYSKNAAANADTNFADIKIGVDIPLSDGTKLGAVVSIPAAGSHGTILSLSGNWNSLLGGLANR
jgi:hypothetical protein